MQSIQPMQHLKTFGNQIDIKIYWEILSMHNWDFDKSIFQLERRVGQENHDYLISLKGKGEKWGSLFNSFEGHYRAERHAFAHKSAMKPEFPFTKRELDIIYKLRTVWQQSDVSGTMEGLSVPIDSDIPELVAMLLVKQGYIRWCDNKYYYNPDIETLLPS